jgi:hypothetical protein
MMQFVIWVLVAGPTAEYGELARVVPSAVLDGLVLTHESGIFLELERFRADPFITAAALLRDVGKERASEFLPRLSRDGRRAPAAIVLCRMLFTAKPEGEFRCPALGLPSFFGDTTFDDWPLRPITVVGGVPFVVVWGYTLAGSPESAWKYVRYCLKECDWGTTEFKLKTAEEKQEALKKLLTSPVWKKPLKGYEMEFLSAQIK